MLRHYHTNSLGVVSRGNRKIRERKSEGYPQIRQILTDFRPPTKNCQPATALRRREALTRRRFGPSGEAFFRPWRDWFCFLSLLPSHGWAVVWVPKRGTLRLGSLFRPAGLGILRQKYLGFTRSHRACHCERTRSSHEACHCERSAAIWDVFSFVPWCLCVSGDFTVYISCPMPLS